MKIILNGREEILTDGLTIAGLIDLKGLDSGTVIVLHNNRTAKREDWPGTALKDNDRLEILRLVGGG